MGGWLAARGSEVRSTKYGKAEDLVLQAEVAFPPGGWSRRSGPEPCRRTGPLPLLVGSEGTMGVLTSATLRMDPIPEKQAFLTFEFETVFDGLEAGRQIMTRRWRPAVMRLYDEADRDKLNDILGLQLTGALLVVIYDGDRRLVDLEAEAVTEICTEAGGALSRPEGREPGGMASTSRTHRGRRRHLQRSSAPPTRSAPSMTCPTSTGRSERTSRKASPSTAPSTRLISRIGSLGGHGL